MNGGMQQQPAGSPFDKLRANGLIIKTVKLSARSVVARGGTDEGFRIGMVQDSSRLFNRASASAAVRNLHGNGTNPGTFAM